MGTDLHLTLVLVGLALAFVGWGLFRSQPVGFTRHMAVGLALFLIGEVLLYGAAWWWALIGLIVPGLLIDVIVGAISSIKRPR